MEFGWINVFGAVIVILMLIPNIVYAITLAILPSCIFLLSGILLQHWLLVVFAVLFAVGHICVTKHNSEQACA